MNRRSERPSVSPEDWLLAREGQKHDSSLVLKSYYQLPDAPPPRNEPPPPEESDQDEFDGPESHDPGIDTIIGSLHPPLRRAPPGR